MRGQHHDFVGERRIASAEHPRDIRAFAGFEGGTDRDREICAQRFGDEARFGVRRLGQDRLPRRASVREQLGRAGCAERRQRWRAGHVAGAIGACPGRAGMIPGSTGGRQSAARQQDRPDCAMRRRDRRLGRRALEVRAFLALEAARRAREICDDLPAHVDARVIVALVAWRDQPVADEHHRRVERRPRSASDRARNEVLAEHQRLRTCGVPRARQHEIPMIGRMVGDERNLLQIPARISRRNQPRRIELRRDIFRRDRIFGASGLAPAQRIRREEQDVRLHLRLIVGQGCGRRLRECGGYQRDERDRGQEKFAHIPRGSSGVRRSKPVPALRRFRWHVRYRLLTSRSMLDIQTSLAQPHVTRRADYTPPDWQVPEIALDFDLDPARTRVAATLHVLRGDAHQRPLRLDGEGQTLLSVKVDGMQVNDWVIEDGTLILPLTGSAHVVETVVEIAPDRNTQLMGLYASGGNLCTQCEAEGFRRITFFPDRPDVLSRYHVRMTADKARYPVLLANGDPVAQGDADDGRHWAEWNDPFPKPSYLFALVAGDLAVNRGTFVTASGRTVALGIWVRASDLHRTDHALDALKTAMAWDERVYGREYDLDVFNIVAVDDFNFGAMENKGLNIFNSRYILADPDTATDYDYDAIAAVVAHEYFHNWSGNRVTCRDWFQLSLKEGFTVYRDQTFSADQGSAAVKRIEDVRGLRAAQFPEDAGPLAHPIRPDAYQEISNFYTATIYNKGAEIIRMLATMLGQERSARAPTCISTGSMAPPRRARISSPASRMRAGST